MICTPFVRWSQVGLVLFASQVATAAMAGVPNGMLIAQVIPDDTLGNEGSVVVDGGITDRIEGGATRGENLFHSFQEFNANAGQEIYFVNPVGIENILSRVTGTNLSEIDGLLGVDGAANLFLLNPNGITFGPNAELDIRGSFTASTADTYQFEGAAEPVAIQGSDFLTMSVPLGVQRGMQPQGDVMNEGDLAVDAGQSLTLFGDTVLSSGSLAVPAGRVEVLGNRVGVIDQALIDVSGDVGGGTVLVGGDYQGQGNVPNAERIYVGSDVVINADSLTAGDGGQVVVWANGDTRFFGDISATGGSEFGNGGLVEVSGLEFLDFQGEVDTSAFNGEYGTLLLDPSNITIVEGVNPVPPRASDGIWAAEEDPGNQEIGVDTVRNLLSTTDVILQASSAFDGDGNKVDGNINWNPDAILEYNFRGTGRKLELQADNSIVFRAANNTGATIRPENATSGPLNVVLNSDRDNTGVGAIVIIGTEINSNGGDITLRGGDAPLDRNGRNLPDNEVILDINAPLETNNLLTSEGASLENPNNTHFAPGTLARNIFARGNSTPTTIGNQDARNIDGIGLNGTILDASGNGTNGGNILLLGGGSEIGRGIRVINSAIQTSDSGNIRLIGLGGLGTDNIIGNDTSDNTQGIRIDGLLTTPSTISSENGDIQLTGYAAGSGGTDVGTWLATSGVEVSSSRNGDINIIGISDSTTNFNNEGVAVSSGAIVEATGSGNINLHGIGGLGTNTGTNPGIHISLGGNANVDGSRVVANTGNVTLTGVGRATGIENYGVQLNGGGLVRSGGDISITGTGGPNAPILAGSDRAEGIRVEADAGGIISTSNNESTITLVSDEIVLQGTERVIGNDDILILQPRTDSLPIVLGGRSEDNNQLNLGTRDLETLADGFSTIFIGANENDSSSFPVEIDGDAVFQDPLVIQGNTISSSDNATILGIDEASITLKAEGNLESPNIIAPGQAVILQSNSGEVFLGDGRSILVQPTGARESSLTIEGNSFRMVDATIDAINSETEINSIGNSPVSVLIEVDNSVSLLNSSILSLTNGAADAGNIEIKPRREVSEDLEVSLEGLSSISTVSLANASGDGGDIIINANRLSNANRLRLENGGQLSASTLSNRNAGNIIANADRITISGRVSDQEVAFPTSTRFEGRDFPENPIDDPTGNVNFSDVIPHISEVVPTDNGAIEYMLEISEPGTSAIFDLDNGINEKSPSPQENISAGAITPVVTINNTLEIFNDQGRRLISNEGAPSSFGAAGSNNSTDPYIRYTFTKPGRYIVRVSTRRLEERFQRINLTGADPTDVLIEVPTLENGLIKDLNEVRGDQVRGNPTLQVSLLDTSFESQSGLFSTTSDQGSAGEISISTPQLNISNGGQVSVRTNNNGTGGTITIESDEINLSGNDSEILASTSGTAPGGSIILQPNTSGNIEINTIGDGPKISASTASGSSGMGGNITIQNAEVAKLDNTELLTSSDGSGRAGNINVQNVDVLLMRRESLIQAGASSIGSGGNVDIDAGFVVTVPSEDNDILANARERAGGNIDITANRIIGFREAGRFRTDLRGNDISDISARSKFDIDGEVSINNLFVDPNQGLNELPSNLVDPANRITQGCRAAQVNQPEETPSSGDFIITGRGGQSSGSANPGGSDITPLDDFGPINSQTNASSTITAISEVPDDLPKELKDSQAAIINESGEVFLIASDGWDSSISCSNLR